MWQQTMERDEELKELQELQKLELEKANVKTNEQEKQRELMLLMLEGRDLHFGHERMKWQQLQHLLFEV